MTPDDDALRLDKWLWAARFFKTRALAAEAINGGKVWLNGARTKPAHAVREGGGAAVRRDAGEPGAARATRGTTPPGRGVGTAIRRTAYQASPAVHRAFHRTRIAHFLRRGVFARAGLSAANDSSNSSTEVFFGALSRPIWAS